MLRMKKIRLFIIVLLVLFMMSSNQVVTAADTGTILDIDIDQSKKEFSMFGITGIQIDIKIEVEFIVQTSESSAHVYFEASVRKSGSSEEVSSSLGDNYKLVNNNTKSTIEFETTPLIITASGKFAGNSDISLKKGNKMVLDLEMSYYDPSEMARTTLDTKSETFYLLASPPTNWIIIAALGGGVILIAIVILFLVYRSKRSENLSWPF